MKEPILIKVSGCSSTILLKMNQFNVFLKEYFFWITPLGYYFCVYQRSEENLFSKASYKQLFLFDSSLRKARLHIFLNSYTLLVFA